MKIRLLPWAACAALVLVLAVRAVLPGKSPGVSSAGAPKGPEAMGPEIRLGPAEVREYRDDGSWNRLTAEGAVYEYARKAVTGRGVVVYLMGGAIRGATARAPLASWDFDRAAVSLPEGCRVDHEGGWAGDLSPATLDFAQKTLHVPGAATLSGPGFSVTGKDLAWNWGEGRITMNTPKSRIHPASAHRPRG